DEIARVDEAEVDDVDGDLGVVTGFELFPHQLFELVRRDRHARRLGDVLRRLADRFDLFAGNADHQSAVGDQRVRTAEGLRDRCVCARGNEHLLAARDHHGFTISTDDDFFAHRFDYSVETTSLPSSAPRIVCHASVAHFTRAGNSDTPENAARRPSSTVDVSPGSPGTSLWKT